MTQDIPDNAITQARFRARYAPRIRSMTHIGGGGGGSLRHTTLRDAVVDLFTCAAADGPFKGNVTSSFSDTIKYLRAAHGRTHPLDEHTVPQ